jgi:hypothetical protein
MSFLINKLPQTINKQTFQSVLSQIGEWMGRSIRWIQNKSSSISIPAIQIQSKVAAMGVLVTANLLIFQLAYRIANLVDPDHNFVRGHRNNFTMELGSAFAITYGLGLLAFTKIVKLPLSTGHCIGLHVAAFLTGVIATAWLKLRS